MATTRSFSAMLNDYAPLELMKEEIIKRDWLLSNVEMDDGWQGASSTSGEAAYIVPFVGAGASSVEFGQLAGSTDIAEDVFVRGRITTQKEVWGSMIFNARDLMEHGKNISEKSFLKILPDRLEAFLQYMKEAVSINLLYGPHFAAMTADTNLASGVCEVDRIDRFSLGQKVGLDDDNSSPTTYYVIAIDVNAGANKNGTVTLSATRGGAAADISAYTTAQNGKFYHPGAQSASFQSLIDALLSATNGGTSTLHGVTKTAYPYLQATQIDGSAVNATNILEKLFDGYTKVRQKAKGKASKILMSYKHLGSIMKLIETQKGGFKVTPTARSASIFGWDEIEITSVRGNLTLVAIQEMPDAYIVYLDPSALVFASNGMFRRQKSPDGNEFYVVRNTTGYQYVVDTCLFGDLVVKAPGHCGIMYSIANY
jgi:hypothetical protein